LSICKALGLRLDPDPANGARFGPLLVNVFGAVPGADRSHDLFINREIHRVDDGRVQLGVLLVAVLVEVKQFVGFRHVSPCRRNR
jgi:hypothetical protein